MRATITSIQNRPSNYGGNVYLVTFACEDGKSRRSWVDPKLGNYKRWKPIIDEGKGATVENLVIKDVNFINADSFPTLVI